MLLLLLLVALPVALQVDCKDMENQIHRERRSDDVNLSGLQAMFEQQANTIQTLQSELVATKNALTEVKTETSNRLTGAENRLAAVEKKQSNPVAFTVRFAADPVTIGINQTLKFDNFVTNIGGGYDTSTGIFTAPLAGLYAFYLDVMNANKDTELEVKLVKNGATVDVTLANGLLDQGSYLSPLHLNKGDKVWNAHYWGDTHLRGGHWTVFSGFLIMAD
ncbi:complement C1q tumor necrosis factor-related protein 3-like [Littorina saxatilis]|uniref:complement C1q tumor necrosis factor-related protein 3-like n=1 Tax=Littorina saxatilis TaxID=31220 RepID=UPI0038B66F66